MLRVTIVFCFWGLLTLPSVASADLVTQIESDSLAFHARLFSSSNGLFEVANTGTTISGTAYTPASPGADGSVVWNAATPGVGGENEGAVDLGDGVTWYAEYSLRFTTEGTYQVHVSGDTSEAPESLAEGDFGGGNNSVWIGGLDVDHLGSSFAFFSGDGYNYGLSTQSWVIDGTNVNQDLTFTVGLREDGFSYDRIAFLRNGGGITDADNATLITSVPEPSSIFLMTVGVIVLSAGRRRSSRADLRKHL